MQRNLILNGQPPRGAPVYAMEPNTNQAEHFTAWAEAEIAAGARALVVSGRRVRLLDAAPFLKAGVVVYVSPRGTHE